MGTFNKGILGGFSGKVGTVIGGNWKGIDYMRSKGNKRNLAPTQAQQAQQLKFGLCVRFVQSMSGLVETSFHNFAVKKTGINSALSYTLKNAVTGTFPTFSIDYSNALVSRGDLPNVLAPSIVMGAGSMLNYAWTDNSGVGIAKATDKAILVAYCPSLNQCIYTTGSATRNTLTDSLNLTAFSGKQVETYIGFISADGFNVASSIYTGTATVS
ncbi:MAG: hypothetical protein JSU03_01745 [Bacteroidetes bacterium]|nr:hypothetical protein [Bacteroidota bacterium]MBS1755979.1 hypothetical protein [Bacteroidota bacterium]